MFGSFILDVAIGMVFIYLTLSLISSGVNEILASIVQSRAANLERGLRSLFSGDSIEAGAKLVDNIYNHGLIRGLYPDPEKDLGDQSPLGWWTKRRLWLQKFLGVASGQTVAGVKNPLLLPSYIPARTFALAMIDILNKNKLDNNKTAIQNIDDFLTSHHQQFKDNKAVEALLSLFIDAKSDAKKEEEKLQRFQTNLENWYNDAMDRVSGWYKRYTQRVLLIVGLVIAIVFNVNSIHVLHVLWVDKDVRTGIAAAGTDFWKNHQAAASSGTAPATGAPGQNGAGQSQTGGQTASGQPSNPAPAQNAQSAANPSGGAPNTINAQTPAAQTGQSAQTDAASQKSAAELASQLKSSVQAFNDISDRYLFPVGWQHQRSDYKKWWTEAPRRMTFNALITLVGWLITAGALSLGASFWFDMLNKIMVVRNTVKPQEKSPAEGSKD
jgi:hypothetical protein